MMHEKVRPHHLERKAILYVRQSSARYEKARRSELVVTAPVGFVKVGDKIEKDPDRRAQKAINPKRRDRA